ncbi:MAG: hypothetical protein L3J06_06755 [Cyclobacteriaceae bacterium]|nr:hypothetical protein [Cyclobacteriaceae bacterium]
MEENERIIKLETQLDKIETERFEYKQELAREKLIRYELEELVRRIYNDCRAVLQEEKKPTLETVLESLSDNIRVMARDYNIWL